MTRLIEATMILHTWYIDLQELFENPVDAQEDIEQRPWMHIGGYNLPRGTENLIDSEEAEQKRCLLKDYLYNFVVEL
jgi:hypothetical protein